MKHRMSLLLSFLLFPEIQIFFLTRGPSTCEPLCVQAIFQDHLTSRIIQVAVGWHLGAQSNSGWGRLQLVPWTAIPRNDQQSMVQRWLQPSKQKQVHASRSPELVPPILSLITTATYIYWAGAGCCVHHGEPMDKHWLFPPATQRRAGETDMSEAIRLS